MKYLVVKKRDLPQMGIFVVFKLKHREVINYTIYHNAQLTIKYNILP